MIEVSKEASNKYKEIAAQSEHPDKLMLRIVYNGYGSGGPKLDVAFDELKNDNDVVLEIDGVKLVYEKEIEKFFFNIQLDYGKRWNKPQFFIESGDLHCC